jgi:hypothetical protein
MLASNYDKNIEMLLFKAYNNKKEELESYSSIGKLFKKRSIICSYSAIHFKSSAGYFFFKSPLFFVALSH